MPSLRARVLFGCSMALAVTDTSLVLAQDDSVGASVDPVGDAGLVGGARTIADAHWVDSSVADRTWVDSSVADAQWLGSGRDSRSPGAEVKSSPGDQATGLPSTPSKSSPTVVSGSFASHRETGRGASVDWMTRSRSLLGLILFLGIAFLLSSDRRRVSWRLVSIGLALNFVFAAAALSGPGEWLFGQANDLVNSLLAHTSSGASFVFGNLAVQNNVPVGESLVPRPSGDASTWIEAAKMAPVALPSGTEGSVWRWAPIGAYFAFGVLPTIIFFSSLMSVLYHLGVMQRVVHGIALAMQWTMRTTGAETLAASANIFVGQTEAPLLVKPFIKDMTQSEIMALMVPGFASVAGGVLVAYVGMLRSVFPDVAGHLIAASFMSAPASLVMAKIMVPEVDPTKSRTFGRASIVVEDIDANVFGAAARGASEGLMLALNVGAMLIAFIALVSVVNGALGWCGTWVGLESPLTLERILGYLMSPLAWCMGIPWSDAGSVGSILGVKTILNEFIGYQMLAEAAPSFSSPRTTAITAYALCGFANFGSIGIQIGGLTPMAPERRDDFVRLGLKAMIAGTLSCFLTACVIGLLL